MRAGEIKAPGTPMKIGIVLPGFSASEADWCIPALLDLVRCLSKHRGIDLHLFPLRYPYTRQQYTVFNAFVHPIGGAHARGSARVPVLTRAIRAIRREHARTPFDLLHAFWADEPGFVTVVSAGMLRIPAVVSLAGGELAKLPEIGYGGQMNGTNRLMTHIAMRSAVVVTAGSSYLLDLARARVKTAGLARLPLGIDLTRFAPGAKPSTPDKSVRILNVASLVPVKDQATLLRAFAMIGEELPGACLHLAGTGPLQETLVRQAAQLGAGDRVVFHGEISHDRMSDLYRTADFCVLSSRFEAQGMVVLESAACGTPTVGTTVGVMPEMNHDGTVDVGDVEGLAQRMIAMGQDRTRRDQSAVHALTRVRAEFGLETATERLLALYRDILHRLS